MKIENKFSPFKGGIALAALAALLVDAVHLASY
jgi:hypothetical protein